MKLKIFPAHFVDINPIMNIERTSFIPQIQEKQKVFEKRLKIFPGGFLILSDCDDETILKNGTARTSGYFCSELWASLPPEDADDKSYSRRFSLGHDIKHTHEDTGPFLYISSWAILKEYRGKGEGKKFFNECVKSICSAYPHIKKVVLIVNEEWKGAVKIYEDAGFEKIKNLENFFPTLKKKEYSSGIIMTCDSQRFRMEHENEETDTDVDVDVDAHVFCNEDKNTGDSEIDHIL